MIAPSARRRRIAIAHSGASKATPALARAATVTLPATMRIAKAQRDRRNGNNDRIRRRESAAQARMRTDRPTRIPDHINRGNGTDSRTAVTATSSDADRARRAAGASSQAGPPEHDTRQAHDRAQRRTMTSTSRSVRRAGRSAPGRQAASQPDRRKIARATAGAPVAAGPPEHDARQARDQAQGTGQ